jgi:RNA polymerase primary sigma factor
MTKTSHAELDRVLDRYAVDQHGFERKLKLLASRLDRADAALEIRDPSQWRKVSPQGSSTRVPVTQQFRRDVDSIALLDREEEARLARRIGLARLRLERVLRLHGLAMDDIEAESAKGLLSLQGKNNSSLPGDVHRRWREWHAMRCEMVERNLYLVLINVERYSHTTANPADMIQEGAAALFRAVDGFDWKRGLLFRTYAVHWLNQAFRSYLYNFNATVRVPVYLQKALKHINDAKLRLGKPKATVEELARETQYGEALVAAALAAARGSRSLDLSFDDGAQGNRLKDLLQLPGDLDPYSPEFEDTSLEDSLDQALEALTDRERFVIQQRFGIGCERERTLAEVADALGVSLERVRQIQMRAIQKLRTPALRRVVEPFLN